MNIGEIPLANITFEWQPWFKQSTNPRPIGERIAAMAKAHNGRIPEDELLREAQEAGSPLHGFFEWDDKKAAERYRSQQARSLLNGLKVTIKIIDKIDPALSTKTQVCFVPEEGTVTTVYTVSTTRIEAEDNILGLSNREQRPTSLLEKARFELRAFRKRYQDLEELEAVFSAIDEFLLGEQVKKAA